MLRAVQDQAARKVPFSSLPALHCNVLNDSGVNLPSLLRAGDVRALSRAISTVENRAPGWSDLLKALFPHTCRARVIARTINFLHVHSHFGGQPIAILTKSAIWQMRVLLSVLSGVRGSSSDSF